MGKAYQPVRISGTTSVTRTREDVYQQAGFSKAISCSVARLCDISFTEISSFIQKNFQMPATASEVVAVRLRETFHKYALPAHPSYFADIPFGTLNALLQANRRAELIEIAVTGYLSFVVAEDREPIPLSRKTREKFLSELAFSIKAEGKFYSEAELTTFADTFAKKFDFAISPARFVTAFIDNRILHVDSGHVRFTLPFMEAYLLAKRLIESPAQAQAYFSITPVTFDHRTFALYAEIGPPLVIVQYILERLNIAISELQGEESRDFILLDVSLSMPFLNNIDRLKSIQNRIQRAEDDVRADRDQSKHKQSLLDAADTLRDDLATRMAATESGQDSAGTRMPGVPNEIEATWSVAVSLLGSGAERLEASVKREIVQKVIRLTGLIIDRWTRANRAFDFASMKNEILQRDDVVTALSKGQFSTRPDDAKKLLAGMLDLLEFIYMMQPFMGAITYLCEEARDAVLAESIVHAPADNDCDELLRNIWLADIDVLKGKKRLIDTVKRLPKSKFLRHTIATQLMARVFWNHWRKEDRLALLDIADESLKGIGVRKKTGEIQRLIENFAGSQEED